MAKKRGMYRSIPRTEGISTTDIVGRMLYLSRDHHEKTENKEPNLIRCSRRRSSGLSSLTESSGGIDFALNRNAIERPSQFFTTSRIIRSFTSKSRNPPKGAKIVYVDGAWDMFHGGHVSILKKAREMGDYLIVGVHGDEILNRNRGRNFPILNLRKVFFRLFGVFLISFTTDERVLSVLGCRYVDDVLIDAPWKISQEMISSFGIDLVCCGRVNDQSGDTRETLTDYRIPVEMGILHPLESDSNLTVNRIIGRIIQNERLYQKKVEVKMKLESEYYSNRYGLIAHEDA